MAPDTGRTSTDPAELDRYRATQQLAYEAVTTVAAELTAGVTEREAAREVERFLVGRGVTEWFHQPFAWFGDRAGFPGRWTPLHFFPTNRRLEEGMAFILDVAPVVDGRGADVGYAACLGENPLWERMVADLEPYRPLVLDGVVAERTLRQIYSDADELIAEQGYRSAHRRYPGGVIGHEIGRTPAGVPGAVRGRRVGGFGIGALRFLGDGMRDALRGRAASPLWNDGMGMDHPITPGLWAVEPHLAFRSVGVKWEEILVVTEDDAFWLDDDLPHVRRWAGDAVGAKVAAPAGASR